MNSDSNYRSDYHSDYPDNYSGKNDTDCGCCSSFHGCNCSGCSVDSVGVDCSGVAMHYDSES